MQKPKEWKFRMARNIGFTGVILLFASVLVYSFPPYTRNQITLFSVGAILSGGSLFYLALIFYPQKNKYLNWKREEWLRSCREKDKVQKFIDSGVLNLSDPECALLESWIRDYGLVRFVTSANFMASFCVEVAEDSQEYGMEEVFEAFLRLQSRRIFDFNERRGLFKLGPKFFQELYRYWEEKERQGSKS